MKEDLLPVATDAVVIVATLGGMAAIASLSIPFGLSWALSYMLTRTLFDTLRRSGGRWAVLLGVGAIVGVLSLTTNLRDYRAEEKRLVALRDWRIADARAALACGRLGVGTEACQEALEDERVKASALCAATGGETCP